MPYVSPVQCLCNQCVGVFENANPATAPMLRQAVADGRVNPEIELLCVPGVPKTPYVSGDPPTISLHVVHLEMVWAFTYGMFVSFEHEMREAMLRKGMHPPEPPYSDEVRRRAGNLLKWSKELHRAYTSWPADAPKPESHLSEEKDLVGKVNTIFLTAVALMLHHEFCHAAHGHMASGRTPQEILEQEKEADDFAHHQFINGFSDEHKRRILGWSILIPSLSCLYLIKDPRALFQTKHPHVHHRIVHALGRLNFLGEENQDYFDGLCISAVTTYMVEQGMISANFRTDPDLKEGFERANEAFEYFLNRLDALDEPTT